jgi:hypothetical protein
LRQMGRNEPNCFHPSNSPHQAGSRYARSASARFASSALLGSRSAGGASTRAIPYASRAVVWRVAAHRWSGQVRRSASPGIAPSLYVRLRAGDHCAHRTLSNGGLRGSAASRWHARTPSSLRCSLPFTTKWAPANVLTTGRGDIQQGRVWRQSQVNMRNIDVPRSNQRSRPSASHLSVFQRQEVSVVRTREVTSVPRQWLPVSRRQRQAYRRNRSRVPNIASWNLTETSGRPSAVL